MNEHPLQTTKRELQQLLGSRRGWTLLIAAGVILGLAGPFGTGEALPLIPRLLYWLVLTVASYVIGASTASVMAELFKRAGLAKWPAVFLGAMFAGFANLAFLMPFNWLVFRIGWSEPGYVMMLAPNVIIISIVVAVTLVSLEDQIAPTEPAAPTPPRILDRLPFDKRGPLVSLSVQDHYVEVTTTKGTELILLRLSDARAEVGNTPGLQVHRSHWVALSAVTSARRDGARAILTLSHGTEIPVSRTYLPAIREAGLLPR